METRNSAARSGSPTNIGGRPGRFKRFAASVKGAGLPPVLDVCCGARMFWFNRADPRAVFVDKRAGVFYSDSREGRRTVTIAPDVVADFRKLPFPSGSFSLVVFDPPHTFSGSGWMGKKYGTLSEGWRDEIRAGFAECFRVLRRGGVLVFKWNEHRVPVSSVLALTPAQPLFGHRSGASARTHWIAFLKEAKNGGVR